MLITCESMGVNPDQIQALNQSLFQQLNTPQCIAAAAPNFNNTLAQALVISEGGKLLKPRLVTTQARGTFQTVTLEMKANKTYTMILSSVSQRDSNGDDPAPVAIREAVAAVGNLRSLLAHHEMWWQSYWAQGASVRLGPDRLLLEGWWYGSQYLFGSATRSTKVPPGLWGPWVSGGNAPGWAGDYTLDYNFQANFWGAVSSNHGESAQPYFDSMLGLLGLGRLRASSASWYDSQGFFGAAGQYVQGMNCGPTR